MQKLKDWLVKYQSVDPDRFDRGLLTLEEKDRRPYVVMTVYNALWSVPRAMLDDIVLGCKCKHDTAFLIESGLLDQKEDGTAYVPDFVKKEILPWAKLLGMSHECPSKKG